VRANFGHEFHTQKTKTNVHIKMCPETINLWAGIVGDCSAGPHILPHRLTGNHYPDFLLRDLPKLLENVSLYHITDMVYA
jgi:hypothetical protein